MVWIGGDAMLSRVLGATEARVHFGELMRRVVARRETLIVERDGKPQVVILAVDEYERLCQAAGYKEWEAALARAAEVGARIEARRGGVALPAAEEVIRATREERDASFDRTLDLR
jgi:prevent-host-death family protein